jgi:hypothetical protein
MARGRRPGTPKTGGRRKGARNRKTAATIAAIEASGLTPLDYMLAVMRNPKAKAHLRFEAARTAAPYVHPKLASIENSGREGGPHIVEIRWKDPEG